MASIYKNGIQYAANTNAANISVDLDGTTVNLQDEINDLEQNTVKVVSQTFTAAEKNQARANLGLANTTQAGASIAVGDRIAVGEVVFVVTGIVSD